jgi:hypothetical protein
MAQPELMRIPEEDQCILDKAIDDLLTSLDESWLVSPTEQLTENTGTSNTRNLICAADLTIGLESDNSFIQNKLKDALALSPGQPSFQVLKEKLTTVFSTSAMISSGDMLISPHFYQCQAKILTKLGHYRSKISNDMVLHYVLGDPIMEMLCTIFSLKVRHYTFVL